MSQIKIRIMKSVLKRSVLFVCLFAFLQAATAQKNYAWKTAQSGGYEYRYVENDPSHARFYTLQNGLTVILSPSSKEPRIQTYIAVKAGSKTDPSDHTGLAHYLEHMLFKGTPLFGSLDWQKEKPLLDQIEGCITNTTLRRMKTIEKIFTKQLISRREAARYAIQ